jgi:hypothetical protein
VFKWLGQPYPVALAGMARSENRLDEMNRGAPGLAAVFTLMVPRLSKAYLSEARTERRFAALRVVEALRLYAAAHEGRLPARLADVTEVVVPDDPVTGRPFEYTREAGRAVLVGPAPTGSQPSQSNALRYELTLQR